MPFKSYLVEKFETTHENIFFRKLEKSLHDIYSEKEGLHVLIGNFSCNGSLIDAIFIKSGQITILEFKDYGGKLEFSENNPWEIFDKQKSTLVKGGARARNPFNQVKAYRRTLSEIFSSSEENILKRKKEIRWDYISTIVLFQQSIELESKSIPSNLVWFFITDINRIYDLLEDINNTKLILSDKEIENILKVLDIRAENQFDPKDILDETNKYSKDNPNLYSSLFKIIDKYKDDKEDYKKILNYYIISLELETYLNSSVKETFSYKFDWNKIKSDNYLLDIRKREIFFEKLVNNHKKKFPKNIFIGLNFKIKGIENLLPLFYTIYPGNDFDYEEPIKINFCEFNIFQDILHKFDVPDEIIEDIINTSNEKNNLFDKINIIQERLDLDIKTTNEFALGLSDDPAYNSQLISELKKIKKIDPEFIPQLFKSFLFKRNFGDYTNNDEGNYPFIQITDLNESQKESMELTVNQPVTVITGPPGTGKSVVVINLIANAILNNKKVLFASKNNHAVDTVKERLDEILTLPYFLRFPNLRNIDAAKLKIRTFLQGDGEKEDLSEEIQHQINKINYSYKRIDNLEKKLQKTTELKIEIIKTKTDIEKKKKEYDDIIVNFLEWEESLDNDLKHFFIQEKCIININRNKLNYLFKKVGDARNNFITRIIFYLFQKKKTMELIKDIDKNLEKCIAEFLSNKHPYISPDLKYIDSFYYYLSHVFYFQKNYLIIKERQLQFNRKIEKIENLITQLQQNEKLLSIELKNLEKYVPNIRIEKEVITDDLKNKCLSLMNLVIKQKINNLQKDEIIDYLDSIPAHRIWRNEDVNKFYYDTIKFLNHFNAVSVTSLSIKNSFPLKNDVFDWLIIDEASQCDIASALPLIFRAKKVIIIGDPLQLKHISHITKNVSEIILNKLNINKFKLNYPDESLYDHSFDISCFSNFESRILKEHYRCHPQIIAFSNDNFYEKILGQELIIRTSDSQYKFEPKGLTWIHVKGITKKNRNINTEEIEIANKLMIKLVEKYPEASLGIITPFKNQKDEMLSRMKTNNQNVQIDTVHGFQGDEKDIIILSLVVTNNSKESLSNFINSYAPYLLNVALTRAKSTLYIIGNHDYCKSLKNHSMGNTYLSSLANYTEKLNRVTENY